MRQFIASTMPDSNGKLLVCGKDFKYLKQVLRLSTNDVIQVRLPSGELQSMIIGNVGNKNIVLVVDNNSEKKQETGVLASEIQNEFVETKIWLFQFLPKAQKMDQIVRQATEAGVSFIVPIVASRSQGNDSLERIDRWSRIIKEARQQSGSPVETKIFPSITLANAMDLWKKECGSLSCSIVMYEENKESVPLHTCLHNNNEKTFSNIALAVGCEGGIAQNEFELLKDTGFIPVHFKTNILRAETAAIYGIAAIQTLVTEKKIWQLKESIC